MRSDDAPAFGEPHPGLHLAADFADHGGAMKQRRGDGKVAAVGGDHRLRQHARQSDRRAPRAEGFDLRVAVEIFSAAVPDRARVVAEYGVEYRYVVRDERPLVA